MIPYPIVNSTIEYHQYIFKKCYIHGCRDDMFIRVFVDNNMMFILFGPGVRFLEIRQLDPLIDDPAVLNGANSNFIKQDIFEEFLEFLQKIIIDHTISQIILSGHSNGMVSATITAFLLLSIVHNDYREASSKIIGSWDEKIQEWSARYTIPLSMFVVGTGGSPCLFTSQSEFKDFYNQLHGRYVHVVSGAIIPIGDQGIPYLDYYSSPIYDLHLYKYGVYIGHIIDDTNNIFSERSTYHNPVYFYKTIINPDYSIQLPWSSELTNHKRLQFKHPNGTVLLSSRGFTHTSPFSKAVNNSNRKSNIFMDGFDELGNRFMNCRYGEIYKGAYAEYNRPGISTCMSYKENIHQFYFYKYLLSIFVYNIYIHTDIQISKLDVGWQQEIKTYLLSFDQNNVVYPNKLIELLPTINSQLQLQEQGIKYKNELHNGGYRKRTIRKIHMYKRRTYKKK